MSMDYPEYLKLRKKSRWLGFLWRVGDAGYYIGLFGAIIAPLYTLIFGFFNWMKGNNPALKPSQILLSAGLFFIGFAILFILSSNLKAYAHEKGRHMDTGL